MYGSWNSGKEWPLDERHGAPKTADEFGVTELKSAAGPEPDWRWHLARQLDELGPMVWPRYVPALARERRGVGMTKPGGSAELRSVEVGRNRLRSAARKGTRSVQ